MTEFESKLIEMIRRNALLFLERGVRLLTDNDESAIGDRIVLACADIQIALELSLRVFLIRGNGLRYIVDSKRREAPTEAELISLYEGNRLKVTEFDALKNSLRASRNPIFDKDDFKIIDRFQLYRNKIVHFCCHIGEGELSELHDDLLYYVVQIVLRLLLEDFEDKTPAEYFEELLGHDFFNLLWNSQGYEKAVMKLASERSSRVGICPICDKATYDMDGEICYFCNTSLLGAIGRTDCRACGGKGSVVYDILNIHLDGNHHSMPGFCQKCEAKPLIFECPQCGQSHWMYTDKYDWMCDEGHCANNGNP